MNIHAWEEDQYSPGLKAKVIAWHRLHNAISAHVADAQNEFVKHEQKKASQRARARGHSR